MSLSSVCPYCGVDNACEGDEPCVSFKCVCGMMVTANNFDHPIYKAIAKLIGDKAQTGEDVTMEVFIDPGRGDLYMEVSDGYRICIAHDSVMHCSGAWSDLEVTEIK